MKRPTYILSPIAYMVRVYHDRYHLNYVHAKKLFVFDIALILGTFFLMFCTVAWKTYDPTITDLVQLNIAAYSEDGTPLARISSGESVTYKIEYNNTSDILMQRPQLQVKLAQFFDITDIRTTNTAYDADTGIFSLPDLRPDQGGYIEIDGIYFGTPDTYEDLQVSLSYVQEGKTKSEVRHARIISSLRDAVLEATLTGPEIIRAVGTYPVSITLTNTGSINIDNVVLSTSTPFGTIVWDSETPIAALPANTSTTISGILTTTIKDTSIRDITLTITPSLLRDEVLVPQDSTQLTINVIHPSIRINSAALDTTTVQGGDTISITAQITNTGDSPLENVLLYLPLDANTIDISRSRTLTTGATIAKNELVLDITTSLAPLESVDVRMTLAVRQIPKGGTDTTLSFTPRITAIAPGNNTPLQTQITTAPVAIGTSLVVQAESRYYTNEGDQLGIGPLPPVVGQETKYWAFITIQNTTSQVSNLSVTGKLGPATSWTGRTSVSAGNDVTYNQTNNSWQYTLQNLAPYQTVGLYIELASKPTETMRGTIPTLIETISIQGQDTYIDTQLTQTISLIEANMKNDSRAIARGIVVQ